MNFDSYIKNLLEKKAQINDKHKIAFIEGHSKRMQDAAIELNKLNILTPVLIFKNEKEANQFNNNGTNIEKIIIGEDPKLFEKLVDIYAQKRKGKETKEQAQELLKNNNYFAIALVEANIIEGAIGGVHYPTSDILRPAFKIIGPVENIKTISSVMIMHKKEKKYIFTDIAVNPHPTGEQILEIAKNAFDFCDLFSDWTKKVAFLSFSTSGTAKDDSAQKMKKSTIEFNKKFNPNDKAIGEIQFDAAFNKKILKSKYKYEDDLKTMPSIFVFPDLNSGNIGYKIAQRMGSWGAIGPIITGLKKPVNDISRGATISDIKYTAIITAIQTY